VVPSAAACGSSWRGFVLVIPGPRVAGLGWADEGTGVAITHLGAGAAWASLTFDLPGVSDQRNEAEGGDPREGGEDPGQAEGSHHAKNAGADRSHREQTEDQGASLARLLSSMGGEAGLGLSRTDLWLWTLDHTDALVVGTVDSVDIGRATIIDRPQKHERGSRTNGIDRVCRTAAREPVADAPDGRRQLGSSVFEQLELTMKVVDRADAFPFGKAAIGTWCQHHNPQYGYQNQQDHYRHSPTTYLRSGGRP